MSQQKQLVTLFLAFAFLGIFSFGLIDAHAQQIELYSEKDINVETIPEIPGPNEQVTLRLNSFSFNLNNYTIAWFKDGAKESSGFGNREFKFTTGSAGDITNITAVIDINGKVLRKELRFAPSQVDLLWEAKNSYTPPFYKGKALPVIQSDIRITAIPETLLIEPSDAPNLVYYWDRNYERQVSKSGFGKYFYDFTIDPLVQNEKITVTSNDRRENSFAKNTLDIPTTAYSPQILFYEVDQNNRILTQKDLATNSNINTDTLRFSFHPLHMSSIKQNFVDLFVDWRVNNTSQPPQDFNNQNELYITSGGQAGVTNISVNLEGVDKLLQKAQKSFNLAFNPQ